MDKKDIEKLAEEWEDFPELTMNDGENGIQENNKQVAPQLNFRQWLAQKLQGSKALMNIPFVERFVDKQLKMLPPGEVETPKLIKNLESIADTWKVPLEQLKPIELPKDKSISDPEKIAQMNEKVTILPEGEEPEGWEFDK